MLIIFSELVKFHLFHNLQCKEHSAKEIKTSDRLWESRVGFTSWIGNKIQSPCTSIQLHVLYFNRVSLSTCINSILLPYYSPRKLCISDVLKVLAMVYAVLVSISRVTDNKHHPGDVVAGALLGLGVALLSLQRILQPDCRWGGRGRQTVNTFLGKRILFTIAVAHRLAKKWYQRSVEKHLFWCRIQWYLCIKIKISLQTSPQDCNPNQT